MALGESATPMGHGLELRGWWLLGGLTEIAIASEELVISYYPNNLVLVDGERAIFHAKMRCTFLHKLSIFYFPSPFCIKVTPIYL